VFAYLTDVTNLPRWQKTSLSAHADGELAVGARIHERREFQGRSAEVELEVTAYDPPTRFELKSLRGPVSYELWHGLRPSDGGTRLHVGVAFKFGALMRVASKAFIKPAEREFQKDFERLKEMLEAGAAS
jgi:polyketide cyclase/dehydrase/lipid transport protein